MKEWSLYLLHHSGISHKHALAGTGNEQTRLPFGFNLAGWHLYEAAPQMDGPLWNIHQQQSEGVWVFRHSQSFSLSATALLWVTLSKSLKPHNFFFFFFFVRTCLCLGSLVEKKNFKVRCKIRQKECISWGEWEIRVHLPYSPQSDGI